MIWWLPLALVLPFFFLWCAAHEGAHALGAKREGLAIRAFKPYPHMIGTRFNFAAVYYSGPSSSTFTKIAPFVFDLIAFAPLAVLLFFVENAWIWTVLATLAACPVVNSIIAVQGAVRRNEHADLSKAPAGWAVVVMYLILCYAATFSVIVFSRFS